MKKDSWTPIMSAAYDEHEELVQILLDAGSINVDGAMGGAFHTGNIAIATRLLDAGAQINELFECDLQNVTNEIISLLESRMDQFTDENVKKYKALRLEKLLS
jgi:ankyrin repeat protein